MKVSFLNHFIQVENRVVGAPCGIMDQMASACGEAYKLLAMVCQVCRIHLKPLDAHISLLYSNLVLLLFSASLQKLKSM